MIDRYNPLTLSSGTDSPTGPQAIPAHLKVTSGALVGTPTRKGKEKGNVSP